MEDTLNQEVNAEDTGTGSEKIDFTLDEKELEDISGGAAEGCTELGFLGSGCTKNGL